MYLKLFIIFLSCFLALLMIFDVSTVVSNAASFKHDEKTKCELGTISGCLQHEISLKINFSNNVTV